MALTMAVAPPKNSEKHDGLLNLPHDNTCLDTFLSCGYLHMQIRGLPDLIRHVGLSNTQKDNESESEGCCWSHHRMASIIQADNILS